MWHPSLHTVLLLLPLANSLPSPHHRDIAYSNATTSTVDLGYARYQARLNSTTSVTNFLGIRYAEAPTGNLRWKAPQSPPTIPGITHADTEPSSCYQTADIFGQAPSNPFSPTVADKRSSSNFSRASNASANFSEDCLFLNVHVPGSVSSSSKATYPVVVWIHGGGYADEDGSMYDGSQLVLDADHEAIAVVMQYRLGLFGFLAGSEVKAGGTLNAGLLDQQFALKWVQSHIASFGGDPTHVTIWGESAGGGSVLQHIIANNGQTTPPLFQNAMTSSAFLPSEYNYDDPIPEALYSEVLAQTKCTTLACLRSVDASVLSNVNDAILAATFFGTYAFAPVVDGEFITQRVTAAFSSKKVNGKLLLSMTNSAEGNIFVNTTTTLTTSQYALQLFPKLAQAQVAQVVTAYAQLGGSTISQIEAINGESILICPTYYALAAFSGKSYKASHGGEFAVSPGTHAQDIPYYFTGFSIPGVTLPPVVDNASFIASFAKSFLSFVVSQNPNIHIDYSDDTPVWPIYSVNSVEMVFNVTAAQQSDIHTKVTDPGLVSRCNLWHSLSDSTFQ